MEAVGEEASEGEVALLNTIVYQHVIPVLIALAVSTNLLNIFMLWKVRKKQRQHKRTDMETTYKYLMWLAVTDLLASSSLVPSLIHVDRMVLPYGWAFYYAHLEIPLMNALTSASVYIVVGLSVDRFVAVCFPRRYKNVNAPRLAVVRITLSLVVPFLIYMPHCFYQRVVCSGTGQGWTYQGVEAVTGSLAWHVWEIIVELCHRMIPSIILAVLNLCIIVTFRRIVAQKESMVRAKRFPNEEARQEGDGGRAQRERRLVHLLVAVVCCFLLTNLPAAVLALKDTAGSSFGSFEHEVFRAVANCLEMLGFSLNFVLYFFFVTEMKRVLFDALALLQSKLCCVASFVKANHSASRDEISRVTASKCSTTHDL
ncbi:probable G-protein coupled receptor AH9.1 [Macrobrachium nipponense]|uniref:probable G-protein coupled receptor AH9.1 n=1 Tax=Macrobrachium nipponense TaxID=159736 RepID=UPI0030C8AA2C